MLLERHLYRTSSYSYFISLTLNSRYSKTNGHFSLQAILLEQPRVISANVGHAWDLPANTFGAAYAKFMGSRNFSPDDRPPVRFMETDELAYVAMRAREVHDFWHTLFDLPTNLMGESALKVIEFQQMYLPMCLMSVVGGSVRFNDKQRKLFFQHYFPWAIRAGMQSTDLMCIYYEKHFHEDLEDVRRKWGITPAPAIPKQTQASAASSAPAKKPEIS